MFTYLPSDIWLISSESLVSMYYQIVIFTLQHSRYLKTFKCLSKIYFHCYILYNDIFLSGYILFSFTIFVNSQATPAACCGLEDYISCCLLWLTFFSSLDISHKWYYSFPLLKVTDVGVVRLAENCKLLENLGIDFHSDLTDVSLLALSRLENLRILRAKSCFNITDSGRQKWFLSFSTTTINI